MTENIVAACLLFIALAIIVILVVYKMKNKNKDITIDQFLEVNYDNLINALKDIVSVLMVNIDSFDSKEEYQKAIISLTIDSIRDNCKDFGIDSALLDLFDRDALTNILYTLLTKEHAKIFNDVPSDILENKKELYIEDTPEQNSDTITEE